MSDPTAAARAKRYRDRRRERDVTERHAMPELVAVIERLAGEVHALAELVRADIHHEPTPVDNRDGGARHALERDVTERHAGEGAYAGARVRARLTSPTGSSEPYVPADRDAVTPAARRILEILAAAPAPASAAAIADALGSPIAPLIAELVALGSAGRVRRIAASSPRERDRWALVAPPASSPSETITCAAYREHARIGHRRDPATGRFRCYVCEPDIIPARDAIGVAPPA